MSGPIVFIIFIIAIELILKSVKDKQKIEQTNQQKGTQVNREPQRTRTLGELKKILDQELQREKQTVLSKRQDKTMDRKNINTTAKNKDNKIDRDFKKDKYLEEKSSINIPQTQRSMESKKIEVKKEELREDILRGIIFSEILSPPKSVENQKRSL